MLSVQDAVFESWDRQAQIVANLADLITPEMLADKSGEDEATVGEHLCHMHGVRFYWLKQVAPEFAEVLRSLYTKNGDDWTTSVDLTEIRAALAASATQVRKATEALLLEPRPGPYDHPIFFLQYMLWHDGWHVSSIMQALRAGGHEPAEEWEDANIWGLWRTEG